MVAITLCRRRDWRIIIYRRDIGRDPLRVAVFALQREVARRGGANGRTLEPCNAVPLKAFLVAVLVLSDTNFSSARGSEP